MKIVKLDQDGRVIGKSDGDVKPGAGEMEVDAFPPAGTVYRGGVWIPDPNPPPPPVVPDADEALASTVAFKALVDLINVDKGKGLITVADLIQKIKDKKTP